MNFVRDFCSRILLEQKYRQKTPLPSPKSVQLCVKNSGKLFRDLNSFLVLMMFVSGNLYETVESEKGRLLSKEICVLVVITNNQQEAVW